MRRFFAALALLFAASGPASAGPGDVDTQLLRPTFSPDGWMGTQGSDPGLKGTWRFGGVLQYERSPMTVVLFDSEIAKLVGDRVGITLGGSYTPVDRLAVGLTLPLYFQGGNFEEFPVKTFSTGDLRADVLWKFMEWGPLTGGLKAELYLPTSIRDQLAGERFPRFAPGISLTGSFGRFKALVEISAMLRGPVQTGYNFNMGQELGLLIGLQAWINRDKLLAMLELQHRGGVSKFLQRGAENPVELRLGARIFATKSVTVDLGLGFGLNQGYGTPDVRGLLGVTGWIRPKPKPPIQVAVEFEDPLDRELDIEEVEIDDEDWEPEPEPPPPLAEVVEDRIEINQDIQFEFNSDVLLEVSYPVLDAVLILLKENPTIAHVVIEGHASFEGSVEYNYDLSTRRARSVFHYLVENGVNMNRLSYRGMGEAVPRDTGADESALAENRRVEFHILQWLDPEKDKIPDWDASRPPVPWRMSEPEGEGYVPPPRAPEPEPADPEPTPEEPPSDDDEAFEPEPVDPAPVQDPPEELRDPPQEAPPADDDEEDPVLKLLEELRNESDGDEEPTPEDEPEEDAP